MQRKWFCNFFFLLYWVSTTHFLSEINILAIFNANCLCWTFILILPPSCVVALSINRIWFRPLFVLSGGAIRKRSLFTIHQLGYETLFSVRCHNEGKISSFSPRLTKDRTCLITLPLNNNNNKRFPFLVARLM